MSPTAHTLVLLMAAMLRKYPDSGDRKIRFQTSGVLARATAGAAAMTTIRRFMPYPRPKDSRRASYLARLRCLDCDPRAGPVATRNGSQDNPQDRGRVLPFPPKTPRKPAITLWMLAPANS